jgi:hypothetical protein
MSVMCVWHDYVPHDTPLVRQYLDFVAVLWWNMSFITTGQTLVLQEVPFGGYRLHLKFKDWFWSNRAGTGRIDDVLEDLYVTPPGLSTPISAGVVGFNTFYDPRVGANLLVLANEPNDTHVAFNRLPPVDAAYWYQPGTMYIPDNLIDDGTPHYPP